ncbi:MAG: tRNA 2-selenouridine(34) synthase MnmH [Gammaproteobacteria bacterium]
MPELIATSRIPDILKRELPLLDVRAPVEFARGAFAAAVNIPLLNDDERQQVGVAYRQRGQEAAVVLGHELVKGELRAQRLAAWQSFCTQHPEGLLYCFRGGQRSTIVQQWLQQAGTVIPRIEGGYKAMRRVLIDTLEQQAALDRFVVVAGKTGSAKTHLIRQLPVHIDLEGRAAHRGSAFGTLVSPQPNQVNFENSVAIDFLKLPLAQLRRIFIEDESHAIGSLSVPYSLYQRMGTSPIALIEETLARRSEIIRHDYIEDNFRQFQLTHPDRYPQLFSDYLLGSLAKIRKRLGGEAYDRIKTIMEKCLVAHLQLGDQQAHEQWIVALLRDYYDPMYEYQMRKKLPRVVFRGNRDEFLQWAGTMNEPVAERAAAGSA